MAVLYVSKMRIATRMQSHALRAEAMESLFCDLQDVSILIGLGLNALFSLVVGRPRLRPHPRPLLHQGRPRKPLRRLRTRQKASPP